MSDRKVSILGGRIAGSTLAYWLAQRGFHAMVVERAADLRSPEPADRALLRSPEPVLDQA